MFFGYGRSIIQDLLKREKQKPFSPDVRLNMESYFTGKGYLVWDIKQEEKTKKWKVFLVKNKKIIEAKGFSIPEIEKHTESLL